jgi:hypothetical protein
MAKAIKFASNNIHKPRGVSCSLTQFLDTVITIIRPKSRTAQSLGIEALRLRIKIFLAFPAKFPPNNLF